MKKTLLSTLAALVATFALLTIATPANAATPTTSAVVNTFESQLLVKKAENVAFLMTASGTVTVQWFKIASKGKQYTLMISATNPVRNLGQFAITKASKDAVVKLLIAEAAKIKAGKAKYPSQVAFVKAIKTAAKV